jgi:hypothetical protein
MSQKYFLVFLILLFHILLPTADCISDWILMYRLVLNGQMNWAKLCSIPIVISTFFHLSAWIFEENRSQVMGG